MDRNFLEEEALWEGLAFLRFSPPRVLSVFYYQNICWGSSHLSKAADGSPMSLQSLESRLYCNDSKLILYLLPLKHSGVTEVPLHNPALFGHRGYGQTVRILLDANLISNISFICCSFFLPFMVKKTWYQSTINTGFLFIISSQFYFPAAWVKVRR